MKRAVLNVAVAALCVAGSAVAQDRNGGMIGSGTRTGDSGQTLGSGNAAGQIMGSGGFTVATQDQYLGNGGRSDDGRQVLGSGMRTDDSGQVAGSGNAVGQMVGSGGFTVSTQDQYMGSGGRTADAGPMFGSGGRVTSQDGGYLGSGLSIRELPLLDGSRVLVVSFHERIFVIPIEE